MSLTSAPSTPEAGSEPGCLRFGLHMLLTSMLAPSAGGAMVAFLLVDGREINVFFRLIGSIVGGPILVIFIWFIVLPFGLVTYAMCLVANRAGFTYGPAWAAGGILIGSLFGHGIAHWSSTPDVLLLTVGGGVIGLLSGLALRRLWTAQPG